MAPQSHLNGGTSPDDDGPCIIPVSSLDWPSPSDEGATVTVQCAGSSYLAYESRLLDRRPFLHDSSFNESDEGKGGSATATSSDAEAGPGDGKKKKDIDLLSLSERKLNKLSYYHVLQASLPMHSSAEEIKRAYHKACLKYHPDKTGRGEDDAVFLLVKSAFDTLIDPIKRRSYDSTVDFNESIPKEGVEEADFYKTYGPVFERNMRFASFNDPALQAKNQEDGGGGGGGKKGNKKKGNKKKGGKGNNGGGGGKPTSAPPFGDEKSTLTQVHEFYDFWVHFDSWRDFTLTASKETDHDVEAADCREEKRWMKNEIDRKVKKMKKEEMARINLLVERAIAADPRLKREKEQEKLEKQVAAAVKKATEEKKAKEEAEAKAKKEAEDAVKKEMDTKNRTSAKKLRETEKKQLRKAKQLLRKLTMAAFQASTTCDGSDTGNDAAWDDMEKMNDDVELLCDKLSAIELGSLSDALGGPAAMEADSGIKVHVEALVEVQQCAAETAAGAERQSLQAIQKRNEVRKQDAEKAREAKLSKATAPWSKDELTALAKAVKKYPPGGSNRWDAIALLINNLCKLTEMRTKEECIEKYNLIASSAAPPSSTSAPQAAPDAAGDGAEGQADGEQPWSEEQDALLQEMLRKHPASMEKNERWKLIAKGVPGRTKKDCVQRFKAIREAVKSKS